MPNKAITFLNSRRSSTTNCDYNYVFASIRGLGAWKFDEKPVIITLSNDVICYGSNIATATASNPFTGNSTYLWSDNQTSSIATGLGVGTYTTSPFRKVFCVIGLFCTTFLTTFLDFSESIL